MEAMNTTAIQVATANKFFNREWNKHNEMWCKLNVNGNKLWFYWASSKKQVGKTHFCEYTFYPDYYEITKHVYNEHGCFWEQTTKHEYAA